jgi:hypothetical protein
MSPEQFRTVMHLKPFKPFSAHTASSESYEVPHPESIWQSPDGFTVVIATGARGACALMGVEHVTEVTYKGAKGARSRGNEG